MATRATYEIDFTTFYIHWDGYPKGAAGYFANALAYASSAEDRAPNVSLADDFTHANPRAGLTRSHREHGDTEYRYTVRTTGDYRGGRARFHITVHKRGSEAFRVIYVGDLRDFIREHSTQKEEAV